MCFKELFFQRNNLCFSHLPLKQTRTVYNLSKYYLFPVATLETSKEHEKIRGIITVGRDFRRYRRHSMPSITSQHPATFSEVSKCLHLNKDE